MEKEIWKDIPQYEGHYQVSSLGRVRSLDRRVKHSNGRTTFIKKGKVMRLAKGRSFYLKVRLSVDGVTKTHNVHVLVAMAFLGHKPGGYALVVDHYPDRSKINNKSSNLRLVTSRKNSSNERGSSKYTGVSWNTQLGKWSSRIYVGGKRPHLGYFENEIDAHNAYQKKLKEIS